MKIRTRQRKHTRISRRLRSKHRDRLGMRLPVTFERLEDRLVLANVLWNIDADGFWDVASNWRDELGVSRLPAVGDDVFLDRPAGTFTVTYRSSASSTVRSLHADRNGLVLSGGSLTITAASEFAASGHQRWQPGSRWPAHRGRDDDVDRRPDRRRHGGVDQHGYLTLSDVGLKRLSGNLFNAGTFVHANTSSDLVNSSLGTVTNLVGAVYDFQGDKRVAIETFINRGTLRKSAGAGTAIMAPRNFSNEIGAIDVNSGTVQISDQLNSMVGGLSTGGAFTVSAGATLDLTSTAQTVHYSGTYTGSGAGAIRVPAGVLQVGVAGATFNFPPGLFQWTGGIIAGGTTGLTNAGSISLAGSDVKFLSGALNNSGTITHTGTGNLQLGGFGLFFSGPEGTVNNMAGGLYDLQGDADFSMAPSTTRAYSERVPAAIFPRLFSVTASTTWEVLSKSARGP